MNARRLVRLAVVTGSLTLAVLLLVGCSGSSVGEIRATGAVTPKALERSQVTAAPAKATEVATTRLTAAPPTATPQPPAAKPTDAPPATEAPVPVSECQPASAGQLERIQAGVKGVAASNEVRMAWAIKSGDFNEVWMVAALIYGPGMETGAGPGVWAINGTPESPGLTLAVDGFAKEFSDWPDASKTGAAINGTEDGIAEAKQCAMENK